MIAPALSIFFNDTFRSTGWREGAKKLLNFQKNNFLKMTFWNVLITSFA